MSAAQMEPRDKMRSRDLNKVAHGGKAPRPAHEPGTVSPPPPPKSADPVLAKRPSRIDNINVAEDPEKAAAPQTRHCYASYVEYHKCIKERGKSASECDKFEKHYKFLCPNEWIERWDQQRELGTFPGLA